MIQEKKHRIDIQDGSHLGFPIGMISAIFDQPITPMLPNKFLVNMPLGSRGEVKNRFSRQPLWISDRNYFSYFLSTSHPDASYPVSSQLAFQFRRRSEKIDFQDSRHGRHLGFPIRSILALFDLQVTLMPPIKFRANWPFGSGEEAKHRFSRCRHGGPSWISDRNDFNSF